MQKTACCFFIGHRETSDEIFPALKDAVRRHITEYGVTEFVVGNYGRFDHMAAKAVIGLKKHYPHITLSMLLPYHPAERQIDLPNGFDNTFYPPGMENVPRKVAIARANRYMINHSDYLISYAWHPASNARELTQYAEKRALRNLIAVTQLAQNKNRK